MTSDGGGSESHRRRAALLRSRTEGGRITSKRCGVRWKKRLKSHTVVKGNEPNLFFSTSDITSSPHALTSAPQLKPLGLYTPPVLPQHLCRRLWVPFLPTVIALPQCLLMLKQEDPTARECGDVEYIRVHVSKKKDRSNDTDGIFRNARCSSSGHVVPLMTAVRNQTCFWRCSISAILKNINIVSPVWP